MLEFNLVAKFFYEKKWIAVKSVYPTDRVHLVDLQMRILFMNAKLICVITIERPSYSSRKMNTTCSSRLLQPHCHQIWINLFVDFVMCYWNYFFTTKDHFFTFEKTIEYRFLHIYKTICNLSFISESVIIHKLPATRLYCNLAPCFLVSGTNREDGLYQLVTSVRH